MVQRIDKSTQTKIYHTDQRKVSVTKNTALAELNVNHQSNQSEHSAQGDNSASKNIQTKVDAMFFIRLVAR